MPDTLIATVGSLLGVALGAAFTYSVTQRAQVSKALHDSRIAAFARFAAAAMEYRRSLMERWYVEHGAPATATSADGVYETRSAAWAALFEVQLLAGEATIGQLARDAVDATSQIKDAGDHAELTTRADESRNRVEAFVVAARDDIAADRRVK
jgi:Tfp pilus assembly protein PilV